MVFRRLFTRTPLHDPREKAWVERRMQWLSEQFGVDVLRNATVLQPTAEHFPEPFSGERSDAERCLKKVCEHLHIRPEEIELRYAAAEEGIPFGRRGGMAHGTYHEEDGRSVITLSESLFTDPEQLIATIAHELAHLRLLGEKRVAAEEAGDDTDHEEVTDLLPVYFGAGIFAANATLRDHSGHDGRWEYWSISSSGYLAARLFGYAFALFAWIRGEKNPSWASHLRKDAYEVFEVGLKYLEKTGDSLFTPESAGRAIESPTLVDLEQTLQRGKPAARVDALWTLAERGASAQSCKDAIIDATRDKHPSIRAAALETLSRLEMRDADLQDETQFRLGDPEPSVRIAATLTLPHVAVNRELAVGELTELLRDSSLRVAAFAAHGLTRFADIAGESCPLMVKPLKRALVQGHSEIAVSLLDSLLTIHPDADAFIAEYLTDPELLREASEMLVELRSEDADEGDDQQQS